MTVGAPAAEANFREAIEAAEKESRHIKEYPVIYVSCFDLYIRYRLHRLLRLSMVRLSRIGTRYAIGVVSSDSCIDLTFPPPRSSAMVFGTGLFLMEELTETVWRVVILTELFVNESHQGVYLARDGSTSVGYLMASARGPWSKSMVAPNSCMALAEVVNLPSKFVSHSPHYVVKDTHWIMW
jgi:hypothetical protein